MNMHKPCTDEKKKTGKGLCPDSGKFLQNKDCPCFPCHADVEQEKFSCLFCYCPLYALGEACGGDFILTESGIKDCSPCIIPHLAENYDHITCESVKLIRKVQAEMKAQDAFGGKHDDCN